MLWAAVDDLMKKDEVTDFGWFLDGKSGYAIGEGDAVKTYTNVKRFTAYFDIKVMEIIPYEVGKQVNRAQLNALMANTK